VANGALVEVRDLTWRPFGRKEPVLSGVGLRIEVGSRVLLAGPSGSGKSTLLRALAGVLTTTETGDLSGSVLIDGLPPAGSSVGLMMQDPGDALVAGRVGRDVAFGPENFGMPRSEIWSRVRSALASVGFPYDENHPTSALSGGEAQRLALAGVLALTPRLLLLDEPTSMLDASSAAVVRGAILSAVRTSGATLVMVEHRLSDWVGEVDRLVVLDPTGRISVDGPVAPTLATSADSLAAQGVWVPGAPPPRPLDVAPELCSPVFPGVAAGQVLVSAESVSVLRKPRASVMSANRPATAVQALLDVTATVGAGEIVAVVGPSGAGKSTLTSLLAGVDAPGEGMVRASDKLLSGLKVGSDRRAGRRIGPRAPSPIQRWSSRTLASRFGWVPQQAEHAVVARTVRGDVLSTSRLLGLGEDAAQVRADSLLEVLGLSSLSDTDPHHLSGGEQRRLALAGAIAHGPSVLVLDEPSVGQDRLTWSAVAGVVLGARDAGMAVVVATHDPLLIDLADRRITLQAGRVIDPSLPHVPAADPRVQSSSPLNKPRERAAAPGPNLGSVVSGTSAAPAPPSSARAAARRPGRIGRPHRLPGCSWSGLAGRSGPLSLLLASIVLVLGAPFISDLRTAVIAFGVEIAIAPVVLGIGRPSWRRLLPGLFAVASVSFSNWLLSPGHEISTGALAGLRVAFFVLPGVLLASRIDPSALGDHLAQRLRLPARPVVAAVAALHRFESLGEQWDQLVRVRRVRGLGPGRSPLNRGRHIAALTFGLLIQTLRQAGRMAVAMEARGFSPAVATSTSVPAPRRTWAEPAPWRPTDSLMLALGIAVAGIPLLLSRL
jgi:energy-coupling factor transporter ATP-binding protein EcfA2/energy-coupling factor transporter transmembrane protein EcfT